MLFTIFKKTPQINHLAGTDQIAAAITKFKSLDETTRTELEKNTLQELIKLNQAQKNQLDHLSKEIQRISKLTQGTSKNEEIEKINTKITQIERSILEKFMLVSPYFAAYAKQNIYQRIKSIFNYDNQTINNMESLLIDNLDNEHDEKMLNFILTKSKNYVKWWAQGLENHPQAKELLRSAQENNGFNLKKFVIDAEKQGFYKRKQSMNAAMNETVNGTIK